MDDNLIIETLNIVTKPSPEQQENGNDANQIVMAEVGGGDKSVPVVTTRAADATD